MKIGDRVFVRGYIDEIRKDTVIIRNAGGYFGTIPSEVTPSAQPEIVRCKDCEYYKSYTLYGQTQGFCNRLGLQATEIDDFCSRAERR